MQQLALSAQDAWVITGCIDSDASNWVTDVAGKQVAVPEGFFKAVLLLLPSEGGKGPFFEARACAVENRSYGFSGFEGKADKARVSIDELEELLQCDLFRNLLLQRGRHFRMLFHDLFQVGNPFVNLFNSLRSFSVQQFLAEFLSK